MIDAANLMYFLPPYRFTSFGMGILLAVFLRNNEAFKLTKVQRMLGNLMSLACAVMTCMIVVWNIKFDSLSQAYFSAFAPITYCLIFAWFILLARSGSESEGKLKFSWKFVDFCLFSRFLHQVPRVEVLQALNQHRVQFLPAPVHRLQLQHRDEAQPQHELDLLDNRENPLIRQSIDDTQLSLSFQTNLNEFALVIASAVVLTVLVEIPFINLRKALLARSDKKAQ
jgi:hypothetical protein